MCDIEFEESAVAFLDVLGFKKLVEDAASDYANNSEKLDRLCDLLFLLDSAIPGFNQIVNSNVPRHLIPRHIVISDSIILSAPISSLNYPQYNGLIAIVMRVIQVAQCLLRYGYLIRGGIDVGKAYHSNSRIIGPAYQNAYCLETTVNDPCVILSETAKNEWNRWNNSIGNNSRMCISKPQFNPCLLNGLVRENQEMIVNALLPDYINNADQHGEIENFYDQIQGYVNNNLNSNISTKAKSKWKWYSKYLEHIRGLLGG